MGVDFGSSRQRNIFVAHDPDFATRLAVLCGNIKGAGVNDIATARAEINLATVLDDPVRLQ